MNQPRFRISPSKDDQYYFNLIAANNEKILTSETYTSRASVLSGIASVKINAPNDARYERLPSGTQFYFVLKAANGEILGTSELYTTRDGRESGIEAVKRNAPSAIVGE